VIEVVVPKITEIFNYIEQALNEEIARETVYPIKFRNLMMNIISINVSTFIFLPVMENVLQNVDENTKKSYLTERRESNVQFILNSLRPE
jgi:hypothetical protein